MEQDAQTYLSEMRRLATLSGRLSEFHVRNLELYVKVTMENIQDANIEYEIPSPGKTEGFVKYTIYTKNKKSAGNRERSVKQRASDLISWTKTLLWSDMKVSVVVNDKEVKIGKPRLKKPTSTTSDSTSTS